MRNFINALLDSMLGGVTIVITTLVLLANPVVGIVILPVSILIMEIIVCGIPNWLKDVTRFLKWNTRYIIKKIKNYLHIY